MATHNEGRFYGIVEKRPKVFIDDGVYIKGTGFITVLKGDRKTGETVRKGKKGFEKVYEYTPLSIISKDPEILDNMKDWKENDLVLIKAQVITTNVTKKQKCPHCGEVYEKEGAVITYLNPVHVSVEKSFERKEDAIEELKRHAEISNQVTVIGVVCADPISMGDYDECVKFPLATDRKYFVASDDPETRTDYPYIHCYGEKNIDATKRIMVGTDVFIEGTLRLRKYPPLEVTCQNPVCKKTFTWTDFTMDVVPYAIELLDRYKTDEMLKEESDKEVDDILASAGLSTEE